jgi:hypothetical protein
MTYDSMRHRDALENYTVQVSSGGPVGRSEFGVIPAEAWPRPGGTGVAITVPEPGLKSRHPSYSIEITATQAWPDSEPTARGPGGRRRRAGAGPAAAAPTVAGH